MRCLTLADALKERGAQIRFICRHLPEHLRDQMSAKGFEFALLDTANYGVGLDELVHAHWLEVDQRKDATDSILALSDGTWDWLIVDHYGLDSRWESMLRKSAKKIFVIDDIADRQHDCDSLLDQNLYLDMESRYTDKVPNACQLMLGPHYALIRPEFRKLHEHVKPRTGKVKRVLIFLGGVDAGNFTGRAIDALSVIDLSDLHVDVVIGTQHPCREQIAAACTQRDFNCHIQTDEMAALMEAADLAIGAGGSASWERCCLGLPALVVALADNQINIANTLDFFGACIYVGTTEVASLEIMQNAIASLFNMESKILKLSTNAYSLVDGLGVDRVCREMGY